MTDSVREDLLERSVIFRSSNASNFQQKVNAAAADIALKDPKIYGASGSPSESPPNKCIKLSEEIRTQRICELREDIEGIDHHLTIKEKRLQQSEASHNYSVCDQFLDQIRELKSTRREKCRELVQLEAKEKQAKRYRALRTATTTSRSVSPVTDHASSITITPTTTSRTPTPTPHSPIGNSPLFIPKCTEKGCTSYVEPVENTGEGTSMSLSQPF